jgi:hypothetical protein
MADETNPPQTPEPASETTPRSRDLTSYIVLGNAGEDHRILDREVRARTPDAAIAQITEGDEIVYTRLVAVPSSSWHEFVQTSAWVKR